MTAPASPAHHAAPGVEVVLLTGDPKLRTTVLAAIEDQRPVFAVKSLDEASSLIAKRQPGVLVTDAESLGPDPARTLARLHEAALDLVIVLAAARGEGPDLPVAGRDVFRTLPRPAGAGQTALAIQAAAARHIELLMGKGAVAPEAVEPVAAARPPRERRRISLAAPLVGLVVAAVTYILIPERLLRDEAAPPAPAPSVAPASAVATTDPEPVRNPASGPIVRQVPPLDPAAEERLDATELALAEGRLAPPAPDNAVENVRAALALAPEDERVQTALIRVVDGLAAGAAAALMRDSDEDAARLVEQALALRPDSPQLDYLSSQIRQEQGRALVAEARAAAEANDWQTTVALLDEAAALLGDDVRVAAYGATDPFLARAEEALAAGNPARADGIVKQVEKVVPDHPRIAPLERAIADAKTQRAAARRRAEAEQAKVAQAQADVRAQIDALVAAADANIAAGRLVGDGDDNALAQLRQASTIKPDDPALLDGFDRLTAALLARVDASLESGEFESAERWVAEASVIGKAPEQVASARDRITLARRAQVSRTVIPASDLKRVAYAAPEYPGRAWRLGVEGWVDVEFDVTRQGGTTAIMVVDAERRGYFEDAVLDAVSRWRYEPRIYDGEPIDQRVRLRINFERTLD